MVIPEAYRVIDDRTGGHATRFLAFDSGPGQKRILIFATDEALRRLVEKTEWYADGTFKTAPKLFYQIYTVHARVDDVIIPLLYCLLPNKEEPTYDRLFEAIDNLGRHVQGHTQEDGCRPTSISVDFEIGVISALRRRWPDAELAGCLFHLGKNIFKHIEKLPDVLDRYTNDEEYKLALKRLQALAFVDPRDVLHYFESLKRDLPDEAMAVADYFERYYVGVTVNGERQEPQFPIKLWNMHHRVIDGLARTNNEPEAWHRRFTANVACWHPTIWSLIDALRSEQKTQENTLDWIEAGAPPTPKKVKYVNRDERLKRLILKEYSNPTHLQFLRGIARNLSVA